MVKAASFLAVLLTALVLATPVAAAPDVSLVDLKPGPSGAGPSEFTALGNSILFSANVGTAGYELWRSDGTAAGAAMVKEIDPTPLGNAFPQSLTALGGFVYFTA